MGNIIIERNNKTAIIRLNRPDKLNALSSAVFAELNPALHAAEADSDVSVIVLTGSGRAFAAGADIAEMQALPDFAAVNEADFISGLWEQVPTCRKPVLAAVNGFALGGGCELAMMCDIIIAAESARFAQPEIKLGTIPGAGGTQRLTRAIGKSKAMLMCLTGRMMSAHDAERAGLVAQVVADDKLEETVLALADEIAAHSLPVIRLVKEAVNATFENMLAQGVHHERRLFHATFGLADREEGMRAFVEKRPPNFLHR